MEEQVECWVGKSEGVLKVSKRNWKKMTVVMVEIGGVSEGCAEEPAKHEAALNSDVEASI